MLDMAPNVQNVATQPYGFLRASKRELRPVLAKNRRSHALAVASALEGQPVINRRMSVFAARNGRSWEEPTFASMVGTGDS